MDYLFVAYPGGIENSTADLIELLFSCALIFSDQLKSFLTVDISGVLLEFYMVINFITRYTFGKRRLEDSYKRRGPSFLQRYREVLPKCLKKSVTSFFKGLLVSLDDSGGPKSKTLTTVLNSISKLGKNFDVESENGLGSILNLPEHFSPLYFTRIWSKISEGKILYSL